MRCQSFLATAHQHALLQIGSVSNAASKLACVSSKTFPALPGPKMARQAAHMLLNCLKVWHVDCCFGLQIAHQLDQCLLHCASVLLGCGAPASIRHIDTVTRCVIALQGSGRVSLHTGAESHLTLGQCSVTTGSDATASSGKACSIKCERTQNRCLHIHAKQKERTCKAAQRTAGWPGRAW